MMKSSTDIDPLSKHVVLTPDKVKEKLLSSINRCLGSFSYEYKTELLIKIFYKLYDYNENISDKRIDIIVAEVIQKYEEDLKNKE